MLNIKDRFKLDAEELKKELMCQVDEYRQQAEKLISAADITDEEKLKGLDCLWSQSAAIFTFLALKAGIEIRTEEGGLLSDSYAGYYMATIFDVRQRIKQKIKKLDA